MILFLALFPMSSKPGEHLTGRGGTVPAVWRLGANSLQTSGTLIIIFLRTLRTFFPFNLLRSKQKMHYRRSAFKLHQSTTTLLLGSCATHENFPTFFFCSVHLFSHTRAITCDNIWNTSSSNSKYNIKDKVEDVWKGGFAFIA